MGGSDLADVASSTSSPRLARRVSPLASDDSPDISELDDSSQCRTDCIRWRSISPATAPRRALHSDSD
eukprot:CAMPEP_0198716302 /NCGR_PEP_ID=MMETSP1471-20131121/37341_1 /TAXON_ID=41880 /ORGANISM="Pycnococcus provasolii, Strain RCC733" /LENGTH=67 /DNA_ID=CAMNT_0044476813 /DNA_START=112 /DNA_END=312 /DNA_ORIENTATION=+